MQGYIDKNLRIMIRQIEIKENLGTFCETGIQLSIVAGSKPDSWIPVLSLKASQTFFCIFLRGWGMLATPLHMSPIVYY
jgi:hypothetical protein